MVVPPVYALRNKPEEKMNNCVSSKSKTIIIKRGTESSSEHRGTREFSQGVTGHKKHKLLSRQRRDICRFLKKIQTVAEVKQLQLCWKMSPLIFYKPVDKKPSEPKTVTPKMHLGLARHQFALTQ